MDKIDISASSYISSLAAAEAAAGSIEEHLPWIHRAIKADIRLHHGSPIVMIGRTRSAIPPEALNAIAERLDIEGWHVYCPERGSHAFLIAPQASMAVADFVAECSKYGYRG